MLTEAGDERNEVYYNVFLPVCLFTTLQGKGGGEDFR